MGKIERDDRGLRFEYTTDNPITREEGLARLQSSLGKDTDFITLPLNYLTEWNHYVFPGGTLDCLVSIGPAQNNNEMFHEEHEYIVRGNVAPEYKERYLCAPFDPEGNVPVTYAIRLINHHFQGGEKKTRFRIKQPEQGYFPIDLTDSNLYFAIVLMDRGLGIYTHADEYHFLNEKFRGVSLTQKTLVR